MIAAIEIGGTKLQIVTGDASGHVRNRWRFEVDRSSGGEGIRAKLSEVFPSVLEVATVEAVGIGFGGPIDISNGVIRCSHQIQGWSEFPLREWVSKQLAVPVVLDNDANVAALGEAICGAGRGFSPVAYVTLGSGVGGGLVVGGKIYHGASPGESEVGHIRLDRSGTIVESRCSGWAVDSKIRLAIQQDSSSMLSSLCAGLRSGEARFLSAALRNADPLARRILAEVCDDLAFALSHLIHLMHPEVIVLGGGLSLVGEALRQGVESAIPQYVMSAFHPFPEIRLASLGEDAVPVGGLILAGQI